MQFKRGVELLYAKLGLPVLPVAVNSGLYWPHGGSRHIPGTVVVSYLETLKPGLSGGEFMRGHARRDRCRAEPLAERNNNGASGVLIESPPALSGGGCLRSRRREARPLRMAHASHPTR